MKPKGSKSTPKYNPLSSPGSYQYEENAAPDADRDTAAILPRKSSDDVRDSGMYKPQSLGRSAFFGITLIVVVCLICGPLLVVYAELVHAGLALGGEGSTPSATCEKTAAGNGFADCQPAPVKCKDQCIFSLAESMPQNLTFRPDEVVHPSTYSGLKMLLRSAKTSVRIASFYWTLRGKDVPFHDNSADEGEDLFSSLLELSQGKKVSVQIVQNAVNNDTDILAKQGGAEVRTLNFTRLMGNGVLHTKLWLVDDQHFYIGSANLDWRSLTQVKELGVVVQNCPCLGQDLLKIFQVYWYLGQPDAKVPATWPSQYNTSINASNPTVVPFNHTTAPVYMSSSPPPFCPGGRTGDIDAIVEVINEAERFVYIAVMDYSPTTLYLHPNKYWPVIDDALRHAAFDRRVTVRLLASRWLHTMKDMYAVLCSLSMMGHVHYPKVRVEVRLFEVPIYSKNQSMIPYARVNHNKYMVTDQHAYIGTSNWSGDYFINTAGVGFVVKQPDNNSTEGNLRRQLYDVFNRDWYSDYSSDLYCIFNASKPV